MISNELTAIEELVTTATPEAATALRDLAETAADREIRKAARRALYRLKQVGVEPPPAAAPTKQRADTVRPPLRAFASAYDGAGHRLIVPILPDPDRGSPTLMQILVSDDEGISELNIVRLGRPALEDRLARYAEQLEAGLAFAEIDGDDARRLIAEFRAINRRLRTPTPKGFMEMLPRLGVPEGEWSDSPVYAALSAEAVLSDENLPRDAEGLFALPWFRAWFLDEGPLWPWLERLSKFYASPIAMTDSVRRESVDRLMDEAADAVMGAELRARYAHRLEETADILRRRERTTPARQALYHALQLKSDLLSRNVAFASLLVSRSIAAVIQLAQENSAPDPNST